MNRGSGGEDYKKRDYIGQPHADTRVESNAAELLVRLPGLPLKGRLAFIDANFFGFLGSLPEEQIWADSGTENSDQCHPVVGIPRDARYDKTPNGLEPGHVNNECRCYVSEQRQAQPFQIS